MNSVRDVRGSLLSHFKKEPQRIISFVPSQTELLYDLGLGERVIGITKFCVHPAKWFQNKTRIGGTKNLDIEKISKLQPDLIIANKEENVKEQIETLASNFPVWVTDVNNLYEAIEMIHTIGSLVGKQDAAAMLQSKIKTAFQELTIQLPSKKIRVCYLIWKEPYLTVGGDTFINTMLEAAGFENVFADRNRYPEVTLENLHQSNCDLLLLSSEPYPFAEKHIEYLQPLLPQIKIILVDGELFSWYGSRLQKAPAYFKALHEQLQML